MTIDSKTYLELTRNIYCPSCQGQVLEESNSPTAKKMKSEIQDMLTKGRTPNEIRMYYTSIYGENVLTQPSFETHNYILWFTPAIAFLIFMIVAIKRMRFAAFQK